MSSYKGLLQDFILRNDVFTVTVRETKQSQDRNDEIIGLFVYLKENIFYNFILFLFSIELGDRFWKMFD